MIQKTQHFVGYRIIGLILFAFIIYRHHSIPDDCFEKVTQCLFQLLDSDSGQIRHYAVSTLLELGANRKEVILKLVPKLSDPIAAVREGVKLALKEMAGKRSFLALLFSILTNQLSPYSI